MKLKYLTAVVLISGITISSCYYDKEDLLYSGAVDCTTTSAKYSTDVAPLITSKCSYSGCHDAGTAAAGVVLENHTQTAAAAGGIKQRCLIDKNMPPGSPLTTNEMAILQCWIDAGTPNN